MTYQQQLCYFFCNELLLANQAPHYDAFDAYAITIRSVQCLTLLDTTVQMF